MEQVFGGLKRRLFGGTPRLFGSIDDALRRVASSDDPFLRTHAAELARDGVTQLAANVPHAECDAVVEAFERYCAESKQSKEYRDEYGKHSRLTNFHLECDVALTIGLNASVLRLLDAVFDRRAAVFSSLVFDRGSQQAIHRDTPFFHTSPANHFFGVWTALEDVHPDAGPLVYYPRGHELELDHLTIGRRHDSSNQAAIFDDYVTELAKVCGASGLPITSPTMKKGDTLIWHPELPHGGGQIVDRTRTRRSIVYHYIPEHTPIVGFDAFFVGKQSNALPRYKKARGRTLVRHKRAFFAHNY